MALITGRRPAIPARFRNARPCGLCANTLFEPLPGRKLGHLCRCSTCGLVCVRRFPERHELHEIYSGDYFKSANSELVGYEDYASDRFCIVKTAHRRLDLIERFGHQRGRILDVGCALGFFLEAAHKRGWEVEGIDISAHAVEFANRELGIPARCGVLDEVQLPPASFDIVTMWDVIEHLPEPVAQLRHVAELLAPGGLAVLSTPDAGSLVARLTGARWMGYKLAEEHLYYFTRRTIALALEQAGLEVVGVRSIGKDVALDFFSRRLRMYSGFAAAAVGKAVELLRMERAAVYVNPGDILCVVARKPRLPSQGAAVTS